MDATNAVQEHTRATSSPIIQILTPPTALLPYNISLNLSSIFAMLPTSKFLTRIRRGMSWSGRADIQYPSTTTAIEWSMETLTEAPQAEATASGLATPAEPFPGPWGFFTSRYMLGLFLMAVVLHRIQNVIIPSRRTHQRQRQRHAFRFAPNFAPRFQRLRALWDFILPLDFSHTTTRLVLHLPSAYFLSKMLLVWILLIIQTSDLQSMPKLRGFGWLESLLQWSSAKEMNDICWATFCSVCAAFLVEGFVKALDGMGTGFPIGNNNPNTSPFNLVGYAFLLNVYSSRLTHSFKPLGDGPSRPDKHVLITIGIPLLQLTVFHFLSISKRLSKHRLLPTALASALSLLHFHVTLLSHYRRFRSASINSLPGDAPIRLAPRINYPLLNYIPNFFETLLICTILLTVFLNALAQLLVRGRIDRVLSGLGIGQGSTLHDDESNSQGFLANLPMEEDFGVLLLRVGIASLEATGLKGWGNEVAPISMPVKHGKTRLTLPAAAGTVRIGRMDVSDVQYGTYASRPPTSAFTSALAGPSRLTDEKVSRGRKNEKQYRLGFNNEVRNIDAGVTDGAAQGRSGYTPWWRWLKEFYAYLATLLGVLKGLILFLLDRARGRVHISESIRKGTSGQSTSANDRAREQDDDLLDALHRETRRWKEKTLYQRFLRGEDISDDEDEDEVRDTLSESSDVDPNVNSDEEDAEWDEDARQAEAVALFTDLMRNGGTSSLTRPGDDGSGGEMVLAHLMHGGGGSPSAPLTRWQWNALLQTGGVPLRRRWLGDDASFSGEENEDMRALSTVALADEDVDSELLKRFENACVICTSEKRDVICWPCRCLAMCDTCREALASKSAPAKHRCPCCRQSVDGYSKIYIP